VDKLMQCSHLAPRDGFPLAERADYICGSGCRRSAGRAVGAGRLLDTLGPRAYREHGPCLRPIGRFRQRTRCGLAA
jgi:hypothetical protein